MWHECLNSQQKHTVLKLKIFIDSHDIKHTVHSTIIETISFTQKHTYNLIDYGQKNAFALTTETKSCTR